MSPSNKASRVLVGLVAAGTTVGALFVDALLPETARQHMRNSRWPAHAKFHNAQYIVMSAVLGGLAMRLLNSPNGDPDHNRVIATAILSVPYCGHVRRRRLSGHRAERRRVQRLAGEQSHGRRGQHPLSVDLPGRARNLARTGASRTLNLS